MKRQGSEITYTKTKSRCGTKRLHNSPDPHDPPSIVVPRFPGAGRLLVSTGSEAPSIQQGGPRDYVYAWTRTHCVRRNHRAGEAQLRRPFDLLIRFNNDDALDHERCDDFDAIDALFDAEVNRIGWFTDRYKITVLRTATKREASMYPYIVFDPTANIR